MTDDDILRIFNIDFSTPVVDMFSDEVTTHEEKLAPDITQYLKAAPMFQKDAPASVELTDEDIESDAEYIAAIEEIESAKREALALEDTRGTYKEEYDSLVEKSRILMDKISALQAEMYEVTTRQNELRAIGFEKRNAIVQAHRTVDMKERRLSVVKSNIAARKRIEMTVEGYQRVAENFSWWSGIDTPDGKTLKILNHQWDGAKFLAASGRAILGDQMGLGKTLTSIAALDLVQSRRALVICPAEVTSNFLREIKRWAPHRHVVNLNRKTKAERNTILTMVPHFEPVIVIVNYEAWRKDLSLLERLIDIQFDTLIADEAHTVKGTNTDAFSGVEKVTLANNVCPYCGELLVLKGKDRKCPTHNYMAGQAVPNVAANNSQFLTRSIKNLWTMTGTPILNAPEDLYPLFYLMDPRAFPYKSQFLREYCQMTDSGKYRFKPGGLDALVKKMSGHYLARTIESANVVLPPQDIIYHTIEFDDDSYKMQQDFISQLTQYSQVVLSENNRMTAIGVLALITRQRQANVWPAGIKIYDYDRDEFGVPIREDEFGNPLEKHLVFDASSITESIKADKVLELAREFVVQDGKRIAVFSQFATALEELQRRFIEAGIRSVRYDGSTPDKLSEEIKLNWDKSNGEEAKWEVILCNYKTGGVGLNITQATHTIILDEEWNPGKRDQAYARSRRMGQDEDTFVHVLRIENTVDDWLAELIEEKEALIAGFDGATIDIQQEMLKAIKDGVIK